ncbi:MAG: hypothetical protein J0L52_03515 [Caulobacterales bacterium]|nr:hypothetical protein [Caulobacterales bacterium]
MNRMALAGVLMAVLLPACGGADEAAEEPGEAAAPAAAPPAPEPEAPSGPAPAEGYDWSIHQPGAEDPDRAHLSYSVPETDDVPLSMTCLRGSGSIDVNTDSGLPGVGAIILRSGEAQAMYAITSRIPSELSGGEFLTVTLPVDDAVLQAFRQAGWINLSVAGNARDLAAHPGHARQAIDRFFSFCAPAPAPATGSEASSEPAPG